MKKKLAAVFAMAGLLSIGVLTGLTFAQGESKPEITVVDQEANADHSKFVMLQVNGATVYSYQPSELYYCNTSVMPVFYYYAGESLSGETAEQKLETSGILKLAEQEKAGVFIFSPGENGYDAEKDYQTFVTVTGVMQDTNELKQCGLDYAKLEPRRWYVFGEGTGSDFVMQNLIGDSAASGSFSGMTLAGATKAPAKTWYAMPAYLTAGSDEAVSALKNVNGTDSQTTLDSGETVFYNSTYVMDGGYTPKRVILGTDTSGVLTPEITNQSWNALLQRVYRAPLENKFMSAKGESAAISGWTVPEEMNLTYRVKHDEDGTLTPNVPSDDYNLWHEWVPNEALSADNTATYPLIVVNHGNGNNPIFTAEMNGWVELAGEERAIVVGLQDIYQAGMPPCSAEERFGTENAAFIRNVICKELPVDMSRIYITGFSIGGFVTADTAAADPGLFAAMAPLAYPADGYMEFYPYELYDQKDGGNRAADYDLPMLYACGKADWGNEMSNPNGLAEEKVSSAQLLINQVLQFNGMSDKLIPLNNLAYNWFPGEHDVKGKGSDGAGYTVNGVNYSTYASYAAKNLNFRKYEWLGYDPVSMCGAVKTEFTTGEGINVDKYVYNNDAGHPMIEQLVMGNMGHNHYGRYAHIVWDDLFSHYSRNTETGKLIYTE